MVERSDDKVDTSEKFREQILRMDKFNKRCRETGIHGAVESVQGHGGRQIARSRPSTIHLSDTKTDAARELFQLAQAWS